ncbi:MAG TPA: hypothetical protein VI997_09575, partial [Candidatus Thermoplasmatota archaeon]|nr:hypothetical protein [Candidatus Thermoplasmatota archaeon]
MREVRVFDEGGGGVAVRVLPASAPGEAHAPAVVVADGPDPRPARVFGLHPLAPEAALAAAAALGTTSITFALDGGTVAVHAEPPLLWARSPRAELLGYVQPAFAARSLELSPLDLDGRHLPQGATAGVPVLLVALADAAALRRARLNVSRLRELVLRFHPDAVVAFVDGDGRIDARVLAAGEPPAVGVAVAALGAWLAEQRCDTDIRVDVGGAA